MHGRHNKVYYYILDIQQLQPRFMYDNCQVNDSYVWVYSKGIQKVYVIPDYNM